MKKPHMLISVMAALAFLIPTAPLSMDAMVSQTANPASGKGQPKVASKSLIATEVVDQLPATPATPAFPGSDPSRWRTEVSTSANIRYQDLYPGIDLVYAGDQERLDAILIVNPGADPDAIHFDFPRAEALALDAQGNVWAPSSAVNVGLLQPRFSQKLTPENPQSQPRTSDQRPTATPTGVPGSFLKLNDHQVGVEVGEYDATEPLLIRFEAVFPRSDESPENSIAVQRADLDESLINPLASKGNGSPMITATKVDALVMTLSGDLDSDGKVDPGDTIRYTVTITNTGMDALGVMFTDTLDPNTTLGDQGPLALPDNYTATGNVPISVPAMSGLLANDSDIDGVTPPASLMVTDVDTTTTQSGTVDLMSATDGSFTYTPPAGFEGVDTFTYEVTDGDGLTGRGAVMITVSDMIWFINNDPGAPGSSPGDGSLNNPFKTLAAFESATGSGGNNPKAGDCIFIATGTSGATNYTGGVTLENNQVLVGEGRVGVHRHRLRHHAGAEQRSLAQHR